MYKKKSQGAIEFLLIFVFVMVLISIIMYVIGYYLVGVQDDELEKEVLDFSNKIIEEYNLVQKLEGGYERKFLLTETSYERFILEINSSGNYMKIIDINRGEDTIFYYRFPSNDIVISLIIEDSNGDNINETYVLLQKKNLIDYQGIDIIN